MVDLGNSSYEDKLSYFQAITGIEDPDLCTDILSAHGWDLELAISSFISSSSNSSAADRHRDRERQLSPAGDDIPGDAVTRDSLDQGIVPPDSHAPPGLARKLVSLPFYVVSGGLGLVSSAIGLGASVAGGALSHSLGLLGLLPPDGYASTSSSPLIPPFSVSAAEAADFVEAFEFEYGGGASSTRPNFVLEGFMDALQRSRRDLKLLFVYLHSPDHPDTPRFCSGCLCVDVVVEFVNANFVPWGGSIRGSEGFRMSDTLKVSRFPFCAIVMAASNQSIIVLRQIEGPKSPEEMLFTLQQVIEESSPVLVTARAEAEERTNNMRLREQQDAAYQAALEADRARECQRKEAQDRLEREAAEAERKRKEEEEEAQGKAAREAAEKEAVLARRRQEIATSLGAEPEKGLDVTQVLVRFLSGERKERRFHSTATIKTLYDYVDSLDCLEARRYSLVSNFPRVIYGPEKHSLTLKEAGLHPQASLFVELQS